MLYSDAASDIEEIDIIPESLEPQPDSPAEDVVSVTLKRENSLRHSQRHAMRNGRCVYTPHASNNLCQSIDRAATTSYRSKCYIGIQLRSSCRTKPDAECLVFVTKQLAVGLLSPGDITHLPCASVFTLLILLILLILLTHHIQNFL